MPSPESSRSNLEHARSVGHVKFWRSRDESQRVKADILRAYFAVPRPSQRAVAGSLRVSQAYVAKLFRKIRREGREKAVGPEADEQYKAFRDVELTNRHEALVAQWQSKRGQTTPPRSPDQAKLEGRQEGPTQYVELGRTTTDEVIELHGSAPTSAHRCDAPQHQHRPAPAPHPTAIHPAQIDAAILAYIGFNANKSKGWF
jgi:hypothetical protein